MKIEISPHARKAMARHDVSEDEIRAALWQEPEFEIIVEGERRYGCVLVQKMRKLMVIWSSRGNAKRVVTCYPLRRKA